MHNQCPLAQRAALMSNFELSCNLNGTLHFSSELTVMLAMHEDLHHTFAIPVTRPPTFVDALPHQF